ncbi:MAG: ribokinase [Oscillochloridaceae bacterium]|nr:ribokinase [Chloroflexaceae bacterium]MDW8389298.1 ribokinase [Oscillochloridaceae bacterium]
MTIVVFGSINMDLVARAPRLPTTGETVPGHTFFTAPGGKGANQAVACARLGAPTRMVGRVGDDALGAELRAGLRAAGVDERDVLTTPGPSGVALIAVDDAGRNTIIVVPGANGAIGPADVTRLETALIGARALLLQLEIPLEAVVAAANAARRAGVPVILDPAPARELPAELYRLADIITPNESEAATLVGFDLSDEAARIAAARALHARTGGAVALKLGEHGALLFASDQFLRLPALPVRAVDTVAAGDAFNAGLAAALVEGQPLAAAVRWAVAAGAVAVTRPGAQAAMPSRAEVLAMLDFGF